MPLHFCHPNTPHRKLRMPEWFVSSLMMDRALDAVVRRAKTLDRKHDIPYLAGYSCSGYYFAIFEAAKVGGLGAHCFDQDRSTRKPVACVCAEH